jgi:hypothetical protein
MTSSRQIDANRRNAQFSTGPVTAAGKQRSRRNAIRHGLTAETIIDALEDAEDYAAFELAVAADFEARSAVERELVLRLASLLWRLRRATAIESGLFKIQARHLLQFRQSRKARPQRQNIIDMLYGNVILAAEPGPGVPTDPTADGENDDAVPGSTAEANGPFDDLTQSFIRLSNLPACPLDRLSRYEATLWRQACQILFALQFLDRGKPWTGMRWRSA